MRAVRMACLCGFLLAGCAADNGLPKGVESAFVSEHPYAKIDDYKKQSDQNGNDQYVITYAHPDGTKATALYGGSGEAESY
jgi:hypothetical protein